MCVLFLFTIMKKNGIIKYVFQIVAWVFSRGKSGHRRAVVLDNV